MLIKFNKITIAFIAILLSIYSFMPIKANEKKSTRDKNMTKNKIEKKIIGWREWVTLPELGIKEIKVKVDTGARTSSLHAFDIVKYKRGGVEYVKFTVHPDQDNSKKSVTCRSKIVEYRKVKSSNGQSELRPVILTNIQLLGEVWPIEITLTNRDEMGFRMLLGRASIKKKFLVNVGKSFYSKKNNK